LIFPILLNPILQLVPYLAPNFIDPAQLLTSFIKCYSLKVNGLLGCNIVWFGESTMPLPVTCLACLLVLKLEVYVPLKLEAVSEPHGVAIVTATRISVAPF
jgi:hypothetical protein